MTGKPILCLDFDGVIHSYTSGWKGASIIPDPPVPGAAKFLTLAVTSFTVCVFSSRSNQEGGLDAMAAYIERRVAAQLPGPIPRNGWGEWLVAAELQFPTAKPPALVTIDDRAITFNGEWPIIADLLQFKPWNKRGV